MLYSGHLIRVYFRSDHRRSARACNVRHMPVLIIVIPLIIRHIVAVALVTGLAQHLRGVLLLLITFAVVILVAKSRVAGSIVLVALGGSMKMDTAACIRLDGAQSSVVACTVYRVILDQNVLLEKHLGQLTRLDLRCDRFLRVEGADFEAAHLS